MSPKNVTKQTCQSIDDCLCNTKRTIIIISTSCLNRKNTHFCRWHKVRRKIIFTRLDLMIHFLRDLFILRLSFVFRGFFLTKCFRYGKVLLKNIKRGFFPDLHFIVFTFRILGLKNYVNIIFAWKFKGDIFVFFLLCKIPRSSTLLLDQFWCIKMQRFFLYRYPGQFFANCLSLFHPFSSMYLELFCAKINNFNQLLDLYIWSKMHLPTMKNCFYIVHGLFLIFSLFWQ